MSKKQRRIKSIFMGLSQGPAGPQLKATVSVTTAARAQAGELPLFIRVYHPTASRAKHFERLLLDGAKRKIEEARDTGEDDAERLSFAVADLLKTAVFVAKTAEVQYGEPMSADAITALEILQLFQALSIRQMLQEQENEREDFCFSGPPGEDTPPSDQSWIFGKYSL